MTAEYNILEFRRFFQAICGTAEYLSRTGAVLVCTRAWCLYCRLWNKQRISYIENWLKHALLSVFISVCMSWGNSDYEMIRFCNVIVVCRPRCCTDYRLAPLWPFLFCWNLDSLAQYCSCVHVFCVNSWKLCWAKLFPQLLLWLYRWALSQEGSGTDCSLLRFWSKLAICSCWTSRPMTWM